MKRITIAYNLSFQENIGAYLPSAYFVEEKGDGSLGYMVARAVPDNIASYGLPIADTPNETLLQICDHLSIPALEEKYNARNKKKILFVQLCEDPKVGAIISQFVQRKMLTFLDLIKSFGLPLCLDIKRQVFLEQIRIHWSAHELMPSLYFKKMKNGIEYRLHLQSGKQIIIPHDHDVHVILDNPGYLLIDYKLYLLQLINGNKVKPFVKKKDVFIPERMTKTYFEKFIMDVVNKVDIDAEGFDVEQIDQIRSVATYFTEDFIENKYILDLTFNYGDSYFRASDSTRRRNRLIMDAEGNVTIKQIVRSEKEKKYLGKLVEIGLHRNAARRFYLDNPDGRYSIIQWVIDHRDFFASNNIILTPPVINGHTVVIEKAEMHLNTVIDNDWFDIKGSIQVGKFTLYFSDLMESIRNDDPLLILPDGTVFIIPESWMTKYSSLARFGKRNGPDFRINKSQYTLMEDTGELSPGIQKMVVQETEVDYEQDAELRAELRPYQVEGVKWLLRHQANGLGACLADDMGLGKTLQTLAVLCNKKNQLKGKDRIRNCNNQLSLFYSADTESSSPLRALVLLPASLVFNWVEEIRKFCPHFLICSYVGADRKGKVENLDQFDVVLTTYQTALRDLGILQKIDWEYIVLDESHMIKNRESKIFRAVGTLKTEHKISLSGTPIENSLADLWSQMQFINPDLLGTFSFFKENFLNPIQKNRDEPALRQLRSLVEPFILRRRKQEVAKDLPEITEQIEYVPMTMEQSEIYEQEKSAARNYLLEMSEQSRDYTFHVLRSLLRLRQIANHPVLLNQDYMEASGKFNQVLVDLHEILKSDHKVLIFSSFTSHLDLFAKRLQEESILYCQLTGQTAQKDRQKEVERFQEDLDYPVFLISMKAGGTGLNLTRADYVFILDPWWNPFVEKQAIARTHRIGSEHPISVIRFISKDSIEEKIIRLQARKTLLSAEIIEDQEQVMLAKDDLKYLLE